MAEKSPVKTQGGWKKEERDGLIALWQGYQGEIEVRTFPKLSSQQVRRVAIGEDHTIFCTEGGQVYTCGSNKHGQLGVENLEIEYSSDPVFVTGLKDVLIREVTCGSNHCAAVTKDGQVFCWGDSSHSQCGQKVDKVSTPNRILIQNISQDTCHHGNPLEVEEIKITQISCGAHHTAALSKNGEIWVWGSGKGLGIKSISETENPVCLQNLVNRNVIAVSCGLYHTLTIVEKSVLPDDVTLTPRGSRLRSSVLDTVTHEYLPSTCAKCNAEIYSYKDLNDTCIISVDHMCDTLKNLDSSLTSHSSSNTATEKQSEEDEVFVDNDSRKDVLQSSETQEGTNACDEESESKSIDAEKTSCEVSVAKNGTENLHITEKSELDCDVGSDIWVKKDSSKGEGHMLQMPGSDELPSSIQESDNEGNNKIEIHVCKETIVSGKDEKLANQNCTESVISKEKLGTNLSRSKSIINEKEARLYLSGQFEEEKDDDKVKSTTHSVNEETSPGLRSTIGNFFSTMQTYPTGMIQSVATVPYHVTSAISNITDRFSATYGAVTLDKDDKSDSSGMDSNLLLVDLDTSEEDLQSIGQDKPQGAGTGEGEMAESSFISAHTPCLDDSGIEALAKETSQKSKSLRTVEVKQERLEKEARTIEQTKSIEYQMPVTIETEVWAWGKNSKGQLGLSDEIDRDEPSLVKTLSNKHVIKISAGAQHSLAMTADSQVYSWGQNASSQLGRDDDPTKPCKIQLIQGCYIWDIAAGSSFSIFLVDRAGFQPEVHYVGKHPTKDLYVPVYKTKRLTALNCLKQVGWIRSIMAGGDNCGCLSCWSFTGFTGTLFEVAATERRFYSYLHRIHNSVVLRLRGSDFYKTMDVFPYKPTMQNLLAAFERITTIVGEYSAEMTSVIRHGQNFLCCNFFTNYSCFVEEFKQYLVCYTDVLAIAGFEFITKSGGSFFDKLNPELTKLLEISANSKDIKQPPAVKLQRLFARPFTHIKEYCRLAEKLSCNYPSDSESCKLLHKVSLNWDSLQHKVNKEQGVAENTKTFWESCNFQKLIDAIKVPSRRLIKDSKSSPLSLQNAGRMSTHNFLLFNDLFVHAQYSSFKVFPLDTLWVEASSSDNEKQQLIILTMPEEKLTLIVPSSESKIEWLMAFHSAINKVLSSNKAVYRRGSTERLTPPDVRHATHGFLRHGTYRDASYSGYWMNGKMHGRGELRWNDGRKYIGYFKDGLQHGHGKLVIIQDDGKERMMEGHWREGHLHGLAKVRYANGDLYEGQYKDGQRHGHGIYKQGQITSSQASVYIGDWVQDKKHGYGVMDDIMKGEKYMGMWKDNQRNGSGIIVTLDGMYFEGTFVSDNLIGQGLMLTYDNSCYEGEFSGITQLQGKGKLTMSNGDVLEGVFSGSWNEGLKINGVFNKSIVEVSHKASSVRISGSYGTMCVPAEQRWEGMFEHCRSMLGVKVQGQPETKKAWENVAVMLVKGRKNLQEIQKSSSTKTRRLMNLLDDLEKIPPYDLHKLTIEYYSQITQYLTKAFEVPFHPLGKLMEGLVEVFRAAYIGIGAHPRLLEHAVKEIRSYVSRLYSCVRILFPDLPSSGGPQQIFSETSGQVLDNSQDGLVIEEEEEIEVVSAGTLLHPLLLPRIYPPLFDLYALYNDKEDEKYWERVKKLNKQGDVGLMAYLGIDQKFWMIDESLFSKKTQSISSIKNHFYTSSVESLQKISTAFSPKDKLEAIKLTFLDITKNMQESLGEAYMCCMDELFPLFQFVVIRAQIHHLGAEIHLIRDLMEPHLENGELGIMFTTLHACYFQIQNEKVPSH